MKKILFFSIFLLGFIIFFFYYFYYPAKLTKNATVNYYFSDENICGTYSTIKDNINLNIKKHLQFKCGTLKSTVLHELKHKYCFKNKLNCSLDNGNQTIHLPLFFKTPLDKEFGIIE